MNSQEINKRIAYLEFANDQLKAELSYVDSLLKAAGFPEGLSSIKEVAVDYIEEGEEQWDEDR